MKSMTDSVAGGGRILNASERVQWTTSMAVETGGVKRGTGNGERGTVYSSTRAPCPVPRPLPQSECVSHPFERVVCNGVGALCPLANNCAHERELAREQRSPLTHRGDELLQYVVETLLDGDVAQSAPSVLSLELRHAISVGIERPEVGEDDVVFNASRIRHPKMPRISIHRVDETVYLSRRRAYRYGVP